MSDNWEVGDVALCVDDRWAFFTSPLRAGERYTVIAVGADPAPSRSTIDNRIQAGRLLLTLLEARNNTREHPGFVARRFIKQPSLVQETDITAILELEAR